MNFREKIIASHEAIKRFGNQSLSKLSLPIRLSLKNQRQRSATCSRNLEIQLQSEIPGSREQVAGR